MAPTAVNSEGQPLILERLRDLIASLPIPTRPPVVNPAEAARGLTLIDMSLRLDHVSRLTEHLRLIDRGHLARSVSVDVDVSKLTTDQRAALEVPNTLTSKDSSSGLWVPVSRYGRSDLAPVVVRNAADEVVPRMTHQETKRVIVAGTLRLLTMLIDAHVASTDKKTKVHELTRRPMSLWLLQAAIGRLVDSGGDDARPDGSKRLSELESMSAAKSGDQRAAAIRLRSAQAADQLLAENLQPFRQLLDHVCSDYLLVVLLPAGEPRQFLTWDAPLLPAARPVPSVRWRRAVLPFNREFVVEYATTLPRAVRSYHLTVEVSEEIHVRRFLLSSNVDEPFMTALVRDLEAIATSLDIGIKGTDGTNKLLELELQSIASRIAELGRRRRVDLNSYERYLEEASAKFGTKLGPRPDTNLGAEVALERLRSGDCCVSVLSSFSDAYAAGHYTHLAQRQLSSAELRRIAAGLHDARFGHDITTDNDPREHGAHAHWRQPTIDLTPKSREPVRAVAYVALADEAPALIESITRMVAGLVIVVAGIGWLLSDGGLGWLLPGHSAEIAPPAQADAVVAVLLLVPGLMLARLDLPSTNTVLGQLRRTQRALATLSVCVTTGLAMAVGAVSSSGNATRAFVWSTGLLLLLLLLCACEFGGRYIRRRQRAPSSSTIPEWLHRHFRDGTHTLPDQLGALRQATASGADAAFTSTAA